MQTIVLFLKRSYKVVVNGKKRIQNTVQLSLVRKVTLVLQASHLRTCPPLLSQIVLSIHFSRKLHYIINICYNSNSLILVIKKSFSVPEGTSDRMRILNDIHGKK